MVVRSSCIPPVNTVPCGGQIIVHSTSQHSTMWWSDHGAFHQSTQYHVVVRSLCILPVSIVPDGVCVRIPPVSTVPRSGQIVVHSTSQHSTMWWSDHGAFHQSTQYHVVVRSLCILPVSIVPDGGQIIAHSTSQHSATWWSDRRAFYQSTRYHVMFRSKACENRQCLAMYTDPPMIAL